MTALLLHVGVPVVRQSVFGDWLIDDGGIVPIRAATCERAFEEAAARSLNSPPVGDPVSFARGSGVATADGAGADSGAAVPPPSGVAPESTTKTSPGGFDSGAASSSSTSRSGTSRAEGVVGATGCEALSPPREASGVSA